MTKKITLKDAQAKFNELNIRFTMKTMRYCAEKDVDLASLTVYTTKNLLDLVMMGTEDINVKKADEVIEEWLRAGYSFPLLHTLSVIEARNSGFFLPERDTAIMGEMDLENVDTLKAVLPQCSQEMAVLTNYLDGMKNVL